MFWFVQLLSCQDEVVTFMLLSSRLEIANLISALDSHCTYRANCNSGTNNYMHFSVCICSLKNFSDLFYIMLHFYVFVFKCQALETIGYTKLLHTYTNFKNLSCLASNYEKSTVDLKQDSALVLLTQMYVCVY